ncbi:MAG UNVERIFIED_CONTAM: hypothetical protein LVR18_47205, partial [Planctomycetaceae bacterium]
MCSPWALSVRAASVSARRMVRSRPAKRSSRHRRFCHLPLDGRQVCSTSIPFDPKPHAPQEIRGSLAAISTALAGVHFTEVHAAAGQTRRRNVPLVRSFSHDSNDHLLSQVYSAQPVAKSPPLSCSASPTSAPSSATC